MAIGKILGVIVGVVRMFGLIPNTEDETSDPATTAILPFLGISDVAGDCGGKKARCMGLIEIAKILLNAAINLAIVLEKGASLAITASMGLINTAALGINLLSLGKTTKILGTFTPGLEKIARCWTTSEDADDKGVTPTQLLRSHAKTLTMF
ncbi:hypothetical protein BGW39_007371 [Mortierella sp. 14UC]|nr:hypothetical protein BGW39_007371 [Mortierella sp. 14UC]